MVQGFRQGGGGGPGGGGKVKLSSIFFNFKSLK